MPIPSIPFPCPALPEEFVIQKLDADCIDSLIQCVQSSFPAPEGEVMAKHLGIFPIDYLAYTHMVCHKALKDGLTYVLYHRPAQEVVCFLISEPLTTAPQYSAAKISPKFKPLIAILEYLDQLYQDFREGEIDDTLHLYMLGTAPHSRQAGYSQMLLEYVLKKAKDHGYKRVLAEATGLGSQGLLEKLGFSVRFEVAYQDFAFEGLRPFEDLKGATHCKLMELCFWDA